jgi:trans-aconitate methyltransferase
MFDVTIGEIVQKLRPLTAFDVGMGMGRMGNLIKSVYPTAELTGFEAHAPYLAEYAGHHKCYAHIINQDFANWLGQNPDFEVDLVMLGDVLEHFVKSRALDVVHMAAQRAKWILAVWPTYCKQGAHGGVVWEGHRCDLRIDDFCQFRVMEYRRRIVAGYEKQLVLLAGWENQAKDFV